MIGESNVWFTADQHFSHTNILKYCQRPWEKIHDMNVHFVEVFNKKVSKEDTVFHLGDFTMKKDRNLVESLLEKLNGNHHLIVGNHDKLTNEEYVDAGFLSVHTSLWIEPPEKLRNLIVSICGSSTIFLAHDPAIAEVVKPNFLLCGHIHSLFLTCKHAINVGVDVWEYNPVSWDNLYDVILIS